MDSAREVTARLPQMQGRPMVTDGGMETDLTFHQGVELPDFAAFPLLEDATGRVLLTDYYDSYAAIAGWAGAGLMLESPTWRANPDWGDRLGYSEKDLDRVNTSAIALLAQLRKRYAPTITDIVVSGMVGPRGDGYRAGSLVDPDVAAVYHGPQIDAFVQAGADMITAYTLTDIGEAIGIVQAARAAGVPVAVSFTVETDGRLANGVSLAQAITEVDAVASPEYFLINCAHPTHLEAALADPGAWRQRIVGIRSNASTKCHAELDEAVELDEGDPQLFATSHHRLKPLLPRLSIVGGCCGTDARHVAAVWSVDQDLVHKHPARVGLA